MLIETGVSHWRLLSKERQTALVDMSEPVVQIEGEKDTAPENLSTDKVVLRPKRARARDRLNQNGVLFARPKSEFFSPCEFQYLCESLCVRVSECVWVQI